MLVQMAEDLIQKGTGIPAPLSRVLCETSHRRLLSLSLESASGPLLSIGSSTISSSGSERNLKALPVLCDEQKNEKRFFFAMTDKTWEVLCAFPLDSQQFFTRLTLDISDNEGTPLRSGIFKIADYFTMQCRKFLQSYLNTLVQLPAASPPETDTTFEGSVLEKVMAFSSEVQCAMVLDEDGYIVCAEGITGPVDGLASALAPLFYRSNNELARLESTDCTAVTLADHEYTIRIGRLPGTALALAISAAGPIANACVNFLHAAASNALSEYGWRTGQLWGIALADTQLSSRIRTSWFEEPQLIPQGKYVARKGGSSFHTSTCRILAKTDTALLTWFDDKTTTTQNGLRPCSTCNP